MNVTNFFIKDFGQTNFIARIEWLKNKLINLPNGIKLIDAGAGELFYKQFCKHLNYVSQDFCQYDGVGNGSGYQMSSWDTSKIDIVSDIMDIPVEDCSFDAVLCSEVFEHIPDPNKAFEELDRILKPGGELLITAPFCSMTHFAPYHYCSGFNKYYWENLLSTRYEIIEITSYGNYFEYLGQEIRAMGRNYELYTGKHWGIWRKLLTLMTLVMLKKINSIDGVNNSAELLTFGYMVHAKKKL